MGADYIEPTAAGRIRILSKVAIVVLTLVLVSFALRTYTDTLPRCDAMRWVRGEIIAGVLMWLSVALVLARDGWRAVRDGRWPPHDADVFFRQKVLQGWRVWLVPADAIGWAAACIWGVVIFGPLFMPLLNRASIGCNA